MNIIGDGHIENGSRLGAVSMTFSPQNCGEFAGIVGKKKLVHVMDLKERLGIVGAERTRRGKEWTLFIDYYLSESE